MFTLIQILGILFPAGAGSFITWMFSRRLYRAKKRKEVHDIYQVMYDDVCATLTQMQDENKKLYVAVDRLERAVTKATVCNHWDDCPMRDELQEQGTNHAVKPHHRQPANKKKSRVDSGTSATQPSATDATVTTD